MAGRPKRDRQIAPNWGGHREGQTGRPKLPEQERASLQVAFRLTQAEADQILAYMREGETLHSTAKRLAMEASARPQEARPGPGWQRCHACGKIFDPQNKKKWCEFCNEPRM